MNYIVYIHKFCDLHVVFYIYLDLNSKYDRGDKNIQVGGLKNGMSIVVYRDGCDYAFEWRTE